MDTSHVSLEGPRVLKVLVTLRTHGLYSLPVLLMPEGI